MNAFLQSFLSATDSLLAFYNSTFFSIVKFIIGIYTAILFVNIILLLVQRGLSGDLKETFLGMNMPKELIKAKGKSKLKIKWEEIKKKMESDDETNYKVAIISADNMINDLIMRMGFPGDDAKQRLDNVQPGQIDNLEDLKKAHEIKERVIHDGTFKLDKGTAETVLSAYEHFLQMFDVLE